MIREGGRRQRQYVSTMFCSRSVSARPYERDTVAWAICAKCAVLQRSNMTCSLNSSSNGRKVVPLMPHLPPSVRDGDGDGMPSTSARITHKSASLLQVIPSPLPRSNTYRDRSLSSHPTVSSCSRTSRPSSRACALHATGEKGALPTLANSSSLCITAAEGPPLGVCAVGNSLCVSVSFSGASVEFLSNACVMTRSRISGSFQCTEGGKHKHRWRTPPYRGICPEKECRVWRDT